MKTILVVDDEYALVENLVELLQDEGYRALSASNGRDGLVRAEAEPPTLVLTDVMMPLGDGRELVLGLRANPVLRAVPVIVMSGSTKSVALSDGKGGMLDVAYFLRKPMTWSAVLGAIRALAGPP